MDTEFDYDFDGDKQLTWMDFLHWVNSGTFGTMEGDERYDPRYDPNGDGRIDIEDFDLLSKRLPRPGTEPE
jgi:hypothetical protein